jgi:hypothetical protein
MYFDPVDAASAQNFLYGLVVGCFACGLDVPLDVREQVTVARGWPWTAAGPVDAMRGRGLSEAAVVDELIALEIAAWEHWRDGLA